jgi:hypothetical protein
MALLVVPSAVLKTQLDYLTATGGDLNGAKLGLFSNNIVPTQDTVIGDLTPCTFPGYALSAAITWGAADIDDSGSAVTLGGLVTFVSSTITTPETVYGAFLQNSGGTVLLAAFRFDTPIAIFRALQAIAIVPSWTHSNPS